MADDGSIFLDEITEMPLTSRSSSYGFWSKVNSVASAAARKSRSTSGSFLRRTAIPSRPSREHKLREDLYYRLNVFPIHAPPLRERLEDIPLLASYFLEILNEKEGKSITSIEPEVLQALQLHSAGQRPRITQCDESRLHPAPVNTITPAALPDELKPQNAARPRLRVLEIPLGLTLEEIQRRVIAATLEYVSGDTESRRTLGHPQTAHGYRRRE